MQIYWKYDINGSDGELSEISTRKIQKQVIKKPMISDAEYLTTDTMTGNRKQWKWFTSCNNNKGACGYHWKIVQKEWKENQAKKKSVHFSYPKTNALIYCSYHMTTNEKYVKE